MLTQLVSKYFPQSSGSSPSWAEFSFNRSFSQPTPGKIFMVEGNMGRCACAEVKWKLEVAGNGSQLKHSVTSNDVSLESTKSQWN